MDTTEKNNLNSINTSSADLPLSAPADQFKKKFDELKLNNLKDSEFSFPDFSKDDTAMEIKKN